MNYGCVEILPIELLQNIPPSNGVLAMVPLDLPRFRGGVKAWVQGIWNDGILSSCLRLFFCSALAEFVFPSRPARL